ncbi:MAG: A24 family peptidase [Anaerovibrio sp.]|uniref:prepilin peptidase n=1 Tax=Anaerovibrio sp. TaxID=1872532 RepID=UPI002605DE14|nr:A24 family peptidase [Anaerovibrio sp.]MDD7678690.1 A24 family peptidase [Anaerovibrio sp.]MDY2603661.1 A24 family peptidase [Anaerovibrio sp.]
MTNSVFTIILIFFILNVGLLSKWLSYLFQENSKELSFPAELGYSWLARAVKILLLSIPVWLAAACTAGSSNAGSSAAEALFFAIYTVFLLTMLCSDIEQQIIFDKQLALFAMFGLLRSLLFSLPWEQHLLAALAGGLSFLLLAILTRGGIGGGDIKLIAALGLWLGGEALKLTALGGIIIGGLWALGAIAVKKKKRTDFIPYAPAFIIAAFAVYILQASHG